MTNLSSALPPFRNAALQHIGPPVEQQGAASTHSACTDQPSDAPTSPYEAAAIASIGSKQLLTLAVNLFFRKYDAGEYCCW